jgi:segregation and condensation protein B
LPTPIDVVEALLFASDTPLEAERIREVLDLADAGEARALVEELRTRYAAADRALTIVEVGGGYRMVTYRQPVSRPEVDAIRGVNSDGVLDNLLERRLIRIGGRKEAPGRPFLYETTREFLVAFGLRDLGDLPKVEGELLVPELAGVAGDGQAQAEQDSGPGGAGVPTSS